MSRTEATALMDKTEGRYARTSKMASPSVTEDRFSPHTLEIEAGPGSKRERLAKAVKQVPIEMEPTAAMEKFGLTKEEWTEIYPKLRQRWIKEGKLRIETDRFDV